MNTVKVVSLALPIILNCACNHPIEIIGEGDVLSSTDTRNCYLEDFKANKPNCAKNTIVGLYQESYFAVPRQGWKFEKWLNYCKDTKTNTCSFNVSADIVDQNWGTTVPPLIAVFANYSSQVYVTFSGQLSSEGEKGHPPKSPLSSLPSPSAFRGNFSYDKSTIKLKEHGSLDVREESLYEAPGATGMLQVAGFSYTFVGISFRLQSIFSGEAAIEIQLGLPESRSPTETPIHGPAIDGYKPWIFSLTLHDSDHDIFNKVPIHTPFTFNGELPELSNFESQQAALHFLPNCWPFSSDCFPRIPGSYSGSIEKLSVLP